MDSEQMALLDQKNFLDTSVIILEDLTARFSKLFEHGVALASEYSYLKNIAARMKEGSGHLQQEIEDLECGGTEELTDKVRAALLRRAERQINRRHIRVPLDFWNSEDMSKDITDRVTSQHMWVTHYAWKTRPGWYEHTRHMHASFLCGRSEGQDWAARVPGTITTIEKALDWLVPAAVKKAQAEGKTVYRQGDMYFLQLKLYRHDMNAMFASRHRWDGATIYSAGSVTHPQHPPVHLSAVGKDGLAWKAVQQKQLGNGNSRVGAD